MSKIGGCMNNKEFEREEFLKEFYEYVVERGDSAETYSEYIDRVFLEQAHPDEDSFYNRRLA